MIKFLHTRIRVSKPAKSIEFYKKVGFELGQQKKSPQGNELAFMHLPDNEHFLELTYSPDYKVTVPDDLMHTCVGVLDIVEYCTKLEDQKIEIWPEGWREKFSTGERKMAFITDPDGYEVEILEIR
ncbi:VOC family protein [Akkermansiaceae bacterium]|jgi:lactoylglutathione lyase|nr:VOC family protein [Verrucomicrobiota bacterium]MDA7499606.1 VOC family protein [Akkermansiaceae bacterium]MDA7516464.1 VOC family protein [bacterium]MBT6168974.1 VOC family protein [Verrucomicrobiota bacterium]MBT6400171.1 VOC family protein [Verrucomicrobiota bacterium]